MQEHGAEGAEKSKLKAPSFTIINGISIRNRFLCSRRRATVVLTRHCVVDAWPVLTAVSLQPHPDGPGGEYQSVTFFQFMLGR